ncbi:hypothetical protein PTTG_08015 [Puccinia triticina 1-1 BBBD Race 1]|uniref:Muskelin N-terminal domain-containing protein n=2 Tax=Puccinia triticina TaxID=208348 RepID=A0A180G810_PUCT1|nr:uncharacterized protein PtA15_12A2 [Puccinia triticina]OAV88452.1 hypothetical protein PTTG_08015 [Puccinia triticina 1-1 BBBD Race 1]WAQ90017.1 hypothetical protein PtA15_12A2 [Puccinia triticina]
MDHALFNHPHPLSYTIHSSSTCSPTYHPFNILDDAPTDPNSRWSGSGPATKASTTTPTTEREPTSANLRLPKRKDYIIIDLGKPSIVREITFGKFHRPHPCNIKLFRIWGSLAPGEGKGDFRALLANQPNNQLNSPTDINSLNPLNQHQQAHHAHHQSFFKQPSQPSSTNQQPTSSSSAAPTTMNRDHPLAHNLNSSNQLDSQDFKPSLSPPIRVRGPSHGAGPRMELLAQGELKNDTIPETVSLRWKNDRVAWFKTSQHEHQSLPQTVFVPVRYIKIEPLSATGSNYNCSIWHISVKGHNEDRIMSPCLGIYEKWRASAAVRLCLKHLRQTGHLEAFQALINSAADPEQSPLLVLPSTNPAFGSASNPTDPAFKNHTGSSIFPDSQSSIPAQFHFEHALVSALHSTLVPQLQPRFGLDGPLNSAFASPCDLPFKIPPIRDAEQVVIQAALDNLFDPWAQAEHPFVTCHQIRPPSTLPSELPCPRGGHQMCIDSKRRKIWLFGGFDGLTDLSDLWVYHLEPSYVSAPEDNGGHSTMMNDEPRFKETADERPTVQSQGNNNTQITFNQWQLISGDVKLDDGPMKRSCHQMVLDEMTGDLYVLGRYIESSRSPIPQPSDSPQSATNGHMPIHSAEETPYDGPPRIDVLRRAAATMDIGWDPRPAPPELDVDELMGDAETVVEPPDEPSLPSVQYNSDMFRFRPFEDPSSDELWDNNGRIGRWECLSQDTGVENGPQLMYDHQMVLDSERRKIYVFGGKIVQPVDHLSHETASSSSRVSPNPYSGLFEYDLTTQAWIQLMTDSESSASAMTETDYLDQQISIPSRMGHSLILDKKRQCLWVLTGERDRYFYSDLWKYDIINHRAELVIADYTYGGKHQQSPDSFANALGSAPEAGFSQRITFDPEADEWHMFCGLCSNRGSGEVGSKPPAKSEMMSSEFWRWRINEGRWTKVAMQAEVDGVPPPRFAHQMVFDKLTKTHYVFGGNPAGNGNGPTRLGDFWKLKLVQPAGREALRRCLFELRRQHFIEMCEEGTDAVGALLYLQNDLSSVTNHLDEREAKLFRACTSHLLAGPGPRVPLLEEAEAEDQYRDLEGNCGDEGGEDRAVKAMKKVSSKRCRPEPQELSLGPRNDTGLTADLVDRYHKIRDQRSQLFQSLLTFFPPSMTEPEENLMDLIDVWGDRESFW